MANLMTAPKICLNMIVRNEAHIIHELFDSVSPFISSWVIVDTGSVDGTQEVITRYMADRGIPGELYERPWVDFGHNRSEALNLAQGHGDYIWVMDADDLLVGKPDFSNLTADNYSMRFGPGWTYWRRQLFRDGLPWYYKGVVHEAVYVDAEVTHAHLYGDYHVESRRLGGRNKDPKKKYERDRDLLWAAVENNPEDERSVYYLAQTYFDMGDYVNAKKWHTRRIEMGGWEEEVFFSMLRVAEAMAALDEPWTNVQDAYLRAWEYRPSRAEALFPVAAKYVNEGRYQLGYLFASPAASIPFPDHDVNLVNASLYTWQAQDYKAICAEHLGKNIESFTLCRQLLTKEGVPEPERQRIANNRDFSVPAMINAVVNYPEPLSKKILLGSRAFGVTVSMVAGPDRAVTERALNSFLTCCRDLGKIGRFLVLVSDMPREECAALNARYPFLEILRLPNEVSTEQVQEQIFTRFWFHIGKDWVFFAPDNYITRLGSILEHEPNIVQVGVNFNDAENVTGTCAEWEKSRRGPNTGNYVLADFASQGASMFETTRIGLDHPGTDGKRFATLDEVLCLKES